MEVGAPTDSEMPDTDTDTGRGAAMALMALPRPLIPSDWDFKENLAALSSTDLSTLLATAQTIPVFRYNYTGSSQVHIGPLAADHTPYLGWNGAWPLQTPTLSECLIDLGDMCGTLLGCVQALAAGGGGGGGTLWETFAVGSKTALTPIAGTGTYFVVPHSTVVTGSGTRLFYDGNSLRCGKLTPPGDAWDARGDASVAFGINCGAPGESASAIGGQYNFAGAVNAITLGGASCNSYGAQCAIAGGSNNGITSGLNTAIAGGSTNTVIDATNSVIAGGDTNGLRSSALNCAVVAGKSNYLFGGSESIIVGGETNQITSSKASVVIGGVYNQMGAGAASAVVGGGNNNDVTATVMANSTLLGGNNTIRNATLANALILGGSHTDGTAPLTGTGGGVFTIGAGVSILNAVYMGFGATTQASVLSNCFTAIFNGGGSGLAYAFCTTDSGLSGARVTLAAGGNSWTSASRRELKEDFADVDEREVARRVRRVQLYTYRFKNAAKDDGQRCFGPVAQEWAAAFQGVVPPTVGEEDPENATGFAVNDAVFVTLAAVKEAHRRIDRLTAQLKSLRRWRQQQRTRRYYRGAGRTEDA